MLSRSEEKRLVGLHRRRERERTGLFLAEGVRVVEALVASKLPIELAVVAPGLPTSERGAALLEALRGRIAVHEVPEPVLARVATTDTPQHVVAVAQFPVISLDAISPRERSLVLVLDGVQDPGNFGVLVRNADAFGAEAVLALEGTVDPWNPKAVRAAAGSSFHVPILDTGTAEALAWLRAGGYRVLAADARGDPAGDEPGQPRVALVVGNEGAGIGAAVGAAADARIAVAIRGSAESLNVGVAAGILLYLLTRGR